ncbi:MAG: MoxR family ATPase [Chloroflexi bacterium]|nr:MoxR family ATPase [Chloroflexota bacterium]MDA8188269.1 MoxR family ATPase [Dehalococcoidales bacterium]
MQNVQDFAENILGNVERVIVGKRAEVELVLVALVCQGHVLIEDVPGVGKTVLAKAIAKSIGCIFKRIQFTPDLLPSDVTGVSVYNQKTGGFEFRPGPIIGQIVLTDEINRATPKTQSALLECMEERQISVDGVTRAMPVPFLVLATQNPIEYEGTFPLPEAQLDRFLMRISLGYPNKQDELTVLERQQVIHPIDQIQRVVSVEELVEIQQVVRRDIYVDPSIRNYVVSIVATTRQHPDVYLGASPRGSLALFRTSQARAALEGRDYVIPDDVKALAQPTLAHRIIVSPSARIRNVSSATIVSEILESLPVPGNQIRR